MIAIDERLHNHLDMVIMGLNRCAFMEVIFVSIESVSIRLRCFKIQRMIMVNVIFKVKLSVYTEPKYLLHIEPR